MIPVVVISFGGRFRVAVIPFVVVVIVFILFVPMDSLSIMSTVPVIMLVPVQPSFLHHSKPVFVIPFVMFSAVIIAPEILS